jgi:putative membrane protein
VTFFDGPPGAWSAGFGSILMWMLAAVAIVAVGQLFTRGLGYASVRGFYGPPGPPTPEQILAERFANGEIDQDEFYERVALPTEVPRPGPTTLPG